jgi:hypothetical protein
MSEAHWKGTSTVIFVSPNLKGSHIAELRLDSPFPLRLHDEPPPVTTNPALWATGEPSRTRHIALIPTSQDCQQ